MPEETQDAQVQDTSTEETKEQEVKDDPIAKLEQKTKSWLGRLEASIKETGASQKQIADTLNALSERLERPQHQSSGPDNLKALNEQLQDMVLNGNVTEAFDTYFNLRTEADSKITNSNRNKAEQAIASLKETPFFANIEGGVRDTTEKYLKMGKDPETAVSLAYNKHRGDYLAGIVATVSKTSPASLEFLSGGKGDKEKTSGGHTGKFPDKLEAAYQRDKGKLWKDRKEFMAAMSPQVKEAHGIG